MTSLEKPRRAPILDGRLSAAMALAGPVRCFADIGADHGRLSAVMLLSGGAEHALVADVSALALKKAQRRIEGLGLSDRVTFAVADGLEALDALNNRTVECVFILGMGGDTISGILSRGAGLLNRAALVLGAQTELPLVRQTLQSIGYRIRREIIASEAGRDYVLMRATPAEPGEAGYTEEEILLGPILLRDSPACWRGMLTRRKRLLAQAVSAMREAGLDKDKARLALFERELAYVERALNATKGVNLP